MKIIGILVCMTLLMPALSVTTIANEPPDVVYVDDDYNSSTPGWGYDHFDNIQEGIIAVQINGTVNVYSGVYYENIGVSNSLELIGEQASTTIIDGRNLSEVVRINEDWVSISGFTITNGSNGITCSADNIQISGNIISNNFDWGIWLSGSYNVVSGNAITNNDNGITLELSSNNRFYHNNIIDNNNQVSITPGYANFWDNGYPSCGNYWSDYTGIDNYSGLNQDLLGSDGVGDTPYNISGGDNQDRYPLMEPYGMTKLTFSMGLGLFKSSDIIKNIGNKTAFNVQWKKTFDGGIILIGRESSGTIQRPLLPGEETSISSRFVLGFGRITITVAVWADNAPKLSGTIEGILLLFFLMISVGG